MMTNSTKVATQICGRLKENRRNGQPLDQDVYDAALWSSMAPLSEWSVANRSNSIDIPDFTRGGWLKNTPVDLSRKGCGNTKVRNILRLNRKTNWI